MSDNTTISLLGYTVFIGDKCIFSSDFRGVVNTINPHCYIIARKDKEYHDALIESDFLIPDGIGILIAARILNGKNISRITGSDLHETILNKLKESGGSCFYLGSSLDTLEKIKVKIKSQFPSVSMGSFSPPFKDEFSREDNELMINKINEYKPEVLFIGMTAPKQEKWVYQNRQKLNVPVICSVGAVFDYYAGTVKRPGKFWLILGLEWLPRFLREPQRLWRRNFISNPWFLMLIMKEKLRIIFSKS